MSFLQSSRADSSNGRARHWHCRGFEFESRSVHLGMLGMGAQLSYKQPSAGSNPTILTQKKCAETASPFRDRRANPGRHARLIHLAREIRLTPGRISCCPQRNIHSRAIDDPTYSAAGQTRTDTLLVSVSCSLARAQGITASCFRLLATAAQVVPVGVTPTKALRPSAFETPPFIARKRDQSAEGEIRTHEPTKSLASKARAVNRASLPRRANRGFLPQ